MGYRSFIPYSTIIRHLPSIIRLGVSEQARGQGQFLEQYRRHGTNLPQYWLDKREAFIARTLPEYNRNKTIRRRLSLIAWAYDPR
jgi:hypothetical protein